MAKEEKELFLRDLCARLPYGVKCECLDVNTIVEYCTIECIHKDINGGFFVEIKDRDINGKGLATTSTNNFDDILPYLRPMSSMTDEEKEHLQSLHDIITDENYGDGYSPAAWDAISEFNDYCHAHHLDNRGLIGKGLALEAPEHTYD